MIPATTLFWFQTTELAVLLNLTMTGLPSKVRYFNARCLNNINMIEYDECVKQILSQLFVWTDFNNFYSDYEDPEDKIITLLYF